MPQPEEVDAAGEVTIDALEHLVIVSRFQDSIYENRPILAGRWYNVLGGMPLESYGMVQVNAGESYAFESFRVGHALGEVVHSLDEGIRYVVRARFPE